MQYGATPVIAAIANGHLEVVQLLLSVGVQLGALKTPVSARFISLAVDLVTSVLGLALPPWLSSSRAQDRNSPLHEAAFHNNAAVLGSVLAKVKETAATPEDANALINLQNQVNGVVALGGHDAVVLYIDALSSAWTASLATRRCTTLRDVAALNASSCSSRRAPTSTSRMWYERYERGAFQPGRPRLTIDCLRSTLRVERVDPLAPRVLQRGAQ